jgi:hypothetical protein
MDMALYVRPLEADGVFLLWEPTLCKQRHYLTKKSMKLEYCYNYYYCINLVSRSFDLYDYNSNPL